MKKTLFTDHRGFSLVEILVAMAIFAFILLGVLSMMGTHISSNYFSKNHSKAVQLAEDGIEILKSADYDTELPSFNGVVNDFDSIPNYPQFRREYSVATFADYSVIQVSVVWRTGGSNSQPVMIKSIRSSL